MSPPRCWAAAAFAERKPAVERRLRRMTEPLARLRVPRTLGASGVAALAIILVLGIPQPEASMDAPAADAGTSLDIAENPLVRLVERGAQAEQPTFVVYDTPPVLQNVGEIQRAPQWAYPWDLMDAGIGGRVEMWLYGDLSGAVANHELKTSSDSEALDRAAAEVVRQMRFRPARNRGEPTAVWVSQWVAFQVI